MKDQKLKLHKFHDKCIGLAKKFVRLVNIWFNKFLHESEKMCLLFLFKTEWTFWLTQYFFWSGILIARSWNSLLLQKSCLLCGSSLRCLHRPTADLPFTCGHLHVNVRTWPPGFWAHCSGQRLVGSCRICSSFMLLIPAFGPSGLGLLCYEFFNPILSTCFFLRLD